MSLCFLLVSANKTIKGVGVAYEWVLMKLDVIRVVDFDLHHNTTNILSIFSRNGFDIKLLAYNVFDVFGVVVVFMC